MGVWSSSCRDLCTGDLMASYHLVGKEEMMRGESNMAISVILVMALLIMSVIAVTFAIWQRKENNITGSITRT